MGSSTKEDLSKTWLTSTNSQNNHTNFGISEELGSGLTTESLLILTNNGNPNESQWNEDWETNSTWAPTSLASNGFMDVETLGLLNGTRRLGTMEEIFLELDNSTMGWNGTGTSDSNGTSWSHDLNSFGWANVALVALFCSIIAGTVVSRNFIF